jgi:hypothetical protein
MGKVFAKLTAVEVGTVLHLMRLIKVPEKPRKDKISKPETDLRVDISGVEIDLNLHQV